MTDTTETLVEQEAQLPDERTLLKEQADVLGIRYSPNIGVDKLKAKILEATEGSTESDEEDTSKEAPTAAVKGETSIQKKTRFNKESRRLVRVQVTCLDPTKAGDQGDIITVRNKYIKRMSKFVLFNKPYHIPALMVDTLREARYTVQITERVNGKEVRRMASMPKYSVQILDPLTKEELERLAKSQALRDNS